jgi:hypothetical protein
VSASGQYRSVNPGWVFAWGFLVVVVAFGFYLQARTIDRLAEDEERIEQAVEAARADDEEMGERLCRLFLDIADDSGDQLVRAAFTDMGVTCPEP